MKFNVNKQHLVPVSLGLIILVLLNLIGDSFYHYDSQTWWQNWFLAYAALGGVWLVNVKRGYKGAGDVD